MPDFLLFTVVLSPGNTQLQDYYIYYNSVFIKLIESAGAWKFSRLTDPTLQTGTGSSFHYIRRVHTDI